MPAGLLDVNVLIALLDPAHPHHDITHDWFAGNRRRGWATCPLTTSGCVRILSNPSYKTVEATPAQVISHLETMCAGEYHEFWPDSIDLLDETLFRREAIANCRQITDILLLALAYKRGGRLVTMDRSIPLRAVRGATAHHLEVIL